MPLHHAIARSGMLNKVVNQALSALRADTPNASDCQAALDHLLQTIDALQSHS